MGKRTVIPFGPQHPVLPEPVHLDLVIEDEKVVEAIPSIGFIHRGLEKLVEKKEFTEMVYVIERICGICSFGHGWGYCGATEAALQLEIPDRAKHLRVIWHELSRLHSHLLWLGLLADGFGFDSLFMHCWRIRETILDILEDTTGGRVIFSVCKVGGVRRDIDDEKLKEIVEKLHGIEDDIRSLTTVFMNDSSVKNRLCGVGTLSKEEAMDLCTVGPMARASGVELDLRVAEPTYQKAGFQMQLHEEGDCYARCLVRIDELFESIRIIEALASDMPSDGLDVPVKGNMTGEAAFRLEQPRGAAFYYAKGHDEPTKFLERMRVRTPTNMNIPAMTKMLQGCDLADVPMIILTIDPCISCTER